MIRHIALFRFRPDVSDDDTERFHHAVVAALSEIPAVQQWSAGPALGLQSGGYDYGLLIDIRDAAAFTEYKSHPAHRALIERHIKPAVAETARIQLAV